ncbi:MAG TPA: hypothetical protein ENN79_05295 [Desulfobacteraceae bacterium]|nr:hypothetical protein [Desulfobacteraceae bacterium]
MKKQTKTNGGRKVHITLPEETHQRLRIKCAIEDVTIQEFVARLIENSVAGVELMQNGGQTQKGG